MIVHVNATKRQTLFHILYHDFFPIYLMIVKNVILEQEKLAIYSIYTALKLIQNFEFKRGGDLYAWYLNEEFEVDPTDVFINQWLTQTDHSASVTDEIAEEIIRFEKSILQDIRYLYMNH